MKVLVWLFRAFVFFALFAFALNNQQESSVRWFFGYEWRAPMVFVVLSAFAVGCALGVFAMVPSWWKHRRVARRSQDGIAPPSAVRPTDASASPATVLEHPPRDGL